MCLVLKLGHGAVPNGCVKFELNNKSLYLKNDSEGRKSSYMFSDDFFMILYYYYIYINNLFGISYTLGLKYLLQQKKKN